MEQDGIGWDEMGQDEIKILIPFFLEVDLVQEVQVTQHWILQSQKNHGIICQSHKNMETFRNTGITPHPLAPNIVLI